jgi:hypothetical protein
MSSGFKIRVLEDFSDLAKGSQFLPAKTNLHPIIGKDGFAGIFNAGIGFHLRL